MGRVFLAPFRSALAAALVCWSPSLLAQPAEPPPPEVTETPTSRPVPPPPPASDETTGTEFKPRFVLETGRTPFSPPNPDSIKFQIHGEYQARFTALSDLPLRPFRNDPSTDSLGQTTRLTHWFRITPQLTMRENLRLVGQIDVPRGFIGGQETEHVDAAEEPYDERQPLKVKPRWLYLEYLSPIGLFRVGQQPSHWGMGLVANDGDHPTLFGDYSGGSIVERLLFATRPLGKDSPFNVALAGDLVFKDANADLTDDETALQGVLALFYQDKHDNMLGFYGVYRHQRRENSLLARSFDETLKVWSLDSSGKFNAKIPGTQGHVFGEYEVSYLLGNTNYVRTVQQTRDNEREDVRAFGAAVRLGAVTEKGEGDDRWGNFVAALEWGWASGDADPNDGVSRRFRFDPNHNVGLILFDEVMNWKTARAASIAQDPELTQRPAPGTDLLASNGSVFGATYLNPTVVVRPVRELDLKFGAVLAQTTADFVDPVRVGTGGVFENFDGGDPRSHDLGIELDTGFEYRHALDYEMTLELGAQGGVFFPGNAFADAAGNKMDNQFIGVGRLGLQY
ncbi:MAG: hypothetical protein KC776_33775 [Myxococcales bacterium]|nr:hypothetical protein [Myxococcales bacterium]MCB9577603.1 hypothetical protein [Polyangiaceae bacterium]